MTPERMSLLRRLAKAEADLKEAVGMLRDLVAPEVREHHTRVEWGARYDRARAFLARVAGGKE